MAARTLIEDDTPDVELVELVDGTTCEVSIHGHKVRLEGEDWFPFQTPLEMFQFLRQYAEDAERWGVAATVQTQQREPDEVPMSRKQELMVWEDDDWLILKMPADVDFIHREGVDMQHCLGHRATAEHYAEQMKGEQDQYSLVKKADGKPYVNFELAITKSSYGGPVKSPTITQIRGRRNQCPPADTFMVPLKKFFDANPEWTVSGHGVRGFDGGVDGDKFQRRADELGL